MKKETLKNALKKGIVILLIVLLSLISFIGIHKRNLNTWASVLPEYQFSKELSKIRTFEFSVDTSTKDADSSSDSTETSNDKTTTTDEATTTDETTDSTDTSSEAAKVPVNDPSVLTKENYEKVKKIAEKRLSEFGIADANVTINEETGSLFVSVPYSKNTDNVASLASQAGKLEIIDTDSKEVLIDKSMIKKASAYYQQADSDTTTSSSDEITYNLGIRLTFTSAGQKKLNEISKSYIETTDENGNASQKTVTVQIDGEDKYITYFSPDGEYTELAIPLYRSVSTDDMETFNKDYNECLVAQAVVNAETMPVVYTLTAGSFIESDFSENFIRNLTIVGIIILAIVLVCTIVKNKKKGIYAALIEIGYIAIHLLVIRAASVTLTLSGLLTIAFMALANYILLVALMNQERAVDKLESFGKFILTVIPFIITVIVFALGKEANIQSVGSVGIWGIFVFVYTLISAMFLLNEKNAKKNGVE